MAFQHVAQVTGGVNFEGLRLGVQVFFTRRKQHIAASRCQPLGVSVKGARVTVKVLMRGKLQAVHKNAGHHHIAQRFGLLHQRNVAVMQVAHGGHKGRFLKAVECFSQFSDGVNNVHESRFLDRLLLFCRNRISALSAGGTTAALRHQACRVSTGKVPVFTALT